MIWRNLFIALALLSISLNAQTKAVVASTASDSGFVYFKILDPNIKAHTKYTFTRKNRTDSISYIYSYTDTIYKVPKEPISIHFNKQTFRLSNYDSSFWWNKSKLKYIGEVEDTLNKISARKYKYEDLNEEDEEIEFIFSFRYGLLSQYSTATGSVTEYAFASGPLKDKKLNLILIKKKKKKK